jgi:hypothetical protein
VLKLGVRNAQKKYLEHFDMLFWREMEISCTDRVEDKEALHTVEEERDVIYTVTCKIKAN